MPEVGFESRISVFEMAKTVHASDLTNTEIGGDMASYGQIAGRQSVKASLLYSL
jgi:hypothetical protein